VKKTSWFAAFALVSAGILAGSAASNVQAVDDPPPEPVTCPLCGGDPMVHVQKTFAICTTAGELLADVIGW
jgi:hypothetical protein